MRKNELVLGIVGGLVSLAWAVLWMIRVIQSSGLISNPDYDAPITRLMPAGTILDASMMLLAVLGSFASFLRKPNLMFLVFLVSSPWGLYFLGAPGMFRWIGILNFVYLLVATLLHRTLRQQARKRPLRHREE